MVTPTVYTPKKLAAAAQLAAAAATLYTVPASTVTQLTSLILVNATTTPHAVTIYLVPSAGAAADANVLCKSFVVPADGLPYELIPLNSQGIYLNAAEFIQGVADAANAVTYQISGVELA